MRRALVIAVLLFFAPVFVAACATETADTNGEGGGAADATEKYTSVSACVDDCQASAHPNCVGICNSTATMCAVSNPGIR